MSASFSLFVIGLSLFFNDKQSLWKACSEKRRFTVFVDLQDFLLWLFFHVNIYLEVFIFYAFLIFLGTKFELLDIINFRFLEARLSSTDEKIVVNSNKSTLFKSIFNNSLFSSV